jgi:hypothetical protein
MTAMALRILPGLWAITWSALIGAALWLLGSDRSVGAAVWCAAPAPLAVVLALTSQEDRGQYLARLMACAGFLPFVLLVFALGDAGAMWPASWVVLLALTLLHLLGFLGGTLLLASVGTALPAAAGVAPLPPARLGERLASLRQLELPLRLRVVAVAETPEQDRPGWTVTLRDPAEPARSHRVLLHLDAGARGVTVRERLGVDGATPATADEASMRAPGEHWFDPARPDAQRVSSRSARATVVEAQDLAGVQLRWTPEGTVAAAVLPTMAGDEAQAWLTLLAAVVTRSGYAWRPRLFGSG